MWSKELCVQTKTAFYISNAKDVKQENDRIRRNIGSEQISIPHSGKVRTQRRAV